MFSALFIVETYKSSSGSAVHTFNLPGLSFENFQLVCLLGNFSEEMLRPSSNHGEDEEMENLTGKAKEEKQEIEIPFCGCLSVRYYQPYFDVDTQDIFNRIAHSFLFCRREENFLAAIGDKPDAYGPIWVWS